MYVIPVLFNTILVSLDNIQEHLENPFDQIGEDDIVGWDNPFREARPWVVPAECVGLEP